MDKRSSTPEEVKRALAAIDKGHQLEGKQLNARDLDRAHRILTGELSPEEARVELEGALEVVIDNERRHVEANGWTDAAFTRALARRLTASTPASGCTAGRARAIRRSLAPVAMLAPAT